jgi:hypothetical protein
MYNCECCEYETNRRNDYFKHLESMKHKQNSDIYKKLYNCDDCHEKLTSKRDIIHHKTLYCPVIKKKSENTTNEKDLDDIKKRDLEILEIKYQYELKLKEAQYEAKIKEAQYESNLKLKESQLQLQLQCETKIKEVIIDSHKNLIEELKTDKAKLEYNVANMTDIAKRSITALTYCRKNFPKAPPLLELEQHETPKLLLEAVPKGIDVAKYLIDLYEDSDKVSPLIANIIIAKYKKKDPTKMSFWNADHARHNFVFVDMLNGVAQWENDKDAINIRSKVIDPMLTHVRGMLVDFNLRITDDLTKKDKSQLDEDLIEGVLISNLSNVSKYQNRCMNMINRVDDKSFSNSIIKIIAPEFQIKYDALEREIEKKEQKKKERRKAYNKKITTKKKSNKEIHGDTNTKVKKQMDEIAKKDQEARQKKIEDDLDEEVRQKDLARKKQLEDRRKNERVIRTYESDVEVD